MRLIQSLLLLFVVMPIFAEHINPALGGTVTVTQEKNALIKHYTNSDEKLVAEQSGRTINFPTQIVRISGTIKAKDISCDEVFNEIEQLYIDYIIRSGLYYLNSYSFCGYDPNTQMATQFIISGYFDPVNDKAVSELTEWLERMKDAEIYGYPFTIEQAKELIVALKVSSGYKDGAEDPNLLIYRSDTSNLLFANYYQMKNELIDDIRKRFYSYNAKEVTAFFEKWFFPGAGSVYHHVLSSSNYVLIEPDRIFIMEKEPQIFTPMLSLNFAHLCFDSKTRFCL